MKKSLKRLVPVFLLLLAVWCVGALATTPARFTKSGPPRSPVSSSSDVGEEDWRLFRTTFPLHMQTLAVVKSGDRVRTLIISEPPPHVTLQQLIAVDPKKLKTAEVKQWTIGFDGWVKDIVVQLPETDPATFIALRDRLSEYLYGTPYGAYALELPIDSDSLRTKYPLDVQVRTVDLERWYTLQKFVQAGSKSGQPVSLDKAPVGVYVSEDPGLVVWVVPKVELEIRMQDARRFSLDSDLILGAVGRGNSVAIFGRERIASVSVMPPLRTETILDLAAAHEGSLGQSYERTLFAAGKSHSRWDWAPIYLSDQLLDTEYGSLLNQTDQMLKGWSMCGLVEYFNFPYAPPSRMPFDGPVHEQLKADGLVFNWNTTGFGVSGQSDDTMVYSVTRTGALPVTYLPEGADEATNDTAIGQAETDAYAYYASLNDPLLARVVQYASLYQVFRTCGVQAKSRELPSWSMTEGLRQIATRVLQKLREAKNDDLNRAVDAEFKAFAELVSLAGEAELDEASVKKAIRELLEETSDYYKKYYKDRGKDGERAVVDVLCRTRESANNPDKDPDFMALLVASKVQSTNLPLALCGVPELQRMFSASRPPTNSGWIRTPTVVFSRTLGPVATGTGGHDLNPGTTRIIRSKLQTPGRIRVDAKNNLVCNPKDAEVVEQYAMLIERAPSKADAAALLEKILTKEHGAVERSMSQALARDAAYRPAERGFSRVEHLPGRGSGAGGPPRKPPAPPGTPPPSDPPNDRDWYSMKPADREVVRLSQKDGLITLERLRNDVPIEGAKKELWNQWDAGQAICGELRCQVRSLDKVSLEIELDPATWSSGSARRFLNSLELQLTRERSGRCVVLHKPGAGSVLSKPARLAEVSGLKVSEAKGGHAGVLVEGVVNSDAGLEGRLTFTIFLAELKDVTEARALQSATGAVTTSMKGGATLREIPSAIRKALVNDLEAMPDWSGGVFGVGEIGDLFKVMLDPLTPSVDVALGWRGSTR